MTWHVLIKVYFVASLVLLLPIVAVLGWVVNANCAAAAGLTTIEVELVLVAPLALKLIVMVSATL